MTPTPSNSRSSLSFDVALPPFFPEFLRTVPPSSADHLPSAEQKYTREGYRPFSPPFSPFPPPSPPLLPPSPPPPLPLPHFLPSLRWFSLPYGRPYVWSLSIYRPRQHHLATRSPSLSPQFSISFRTPVIPRGPPSSFPSPFTPPGFNYLALYQLEPGEAPFFPSDVSIYSGSPCFAPGRARTVLR